MPIFAMPSISPWKALLMIAAIVLTMVFFPPLVSEIIIGALIVYIVYRIVKG